MLRCAWLGLPPLYWHAYIIGIDHSLLPYACLPCEGNYGQLLAINTPLLGGQKDGYLVKLTLIHNGRRAWMCDCVTVSDFHNAAMCWRSIASASTDRVNTQWTRRFDVPAPRPSRAVRGGTRLRSGPGRILVPAGPVFSPLGRDPHGKGRCPEGRWAHCKLWA